MSKIKYGLLIGINYKQTSFPLSGCWNDVEEVNLFLKSHNYINIILTDNLDSTSDLYPTFSNIKKQYDFILSKSPDQVFFYFSGHGGQVFDFDKDEKDKKDECIWVYKTSNTVVPITDDQMNNYFINKLNNTTILSCVFDSCHSESILDIQYRYKFIKNKPTYELITKKVSNKNVICISGCQDNDYSGETFINGKVRGILTFSLLNVLSKNNIGTPVEIIYRNAVNNMKLSRLSSQQPQLCVTKQVLRSFHII
jgi:hypothetical protein